MSETKTIGILNRLDLIFVWPVLLYRYCQFGYTYRRIYLGEGLWTILELTDFYRLRNFKWVAYGNGNNLYAVRLKLVGVEKTAMSYMHREIMNPTDDRLVDHRNCHSLDNRRDNLRWATKSQNSCNKRKTRSKTSSCYVGVSFHKKREHWDAQIRVQGKLKHLGSFDNEIDAARAYDEAAKKYHGEFARLNFPEAASSPRRFLLEIAGDIYCSIETKTIKCRLDCLFEKAGANMKRLILRPSVAAAIVLTFLVLLGLNGPASIGAAEGVSEANRPGLIIHADAGKDTIRPEVYGHFAEHLGRCVYEGFWVGEDSNIPNTRGIRNDVVEALKKINVPVIRWPGGCFADEYHWRDGIGPADKRPAMVNTHWGMVTENNHFGTHEFMDLCEMLGSQAYISGNVGSGTPEEMQDWVEYMTFGGRSQMADLRRANGREKPWKVKYFAVGNENWGCGGNMTPEYYADVFKRYATYVRNYPGNNITRIACGPSGADYRWLDVVMNKAAGQMDAISMHYYVMAGDWGHKGSAINFDETGWFNVLKNTLGLDDILTRAEKVMDKYDRQGRIGLYVDEWGTWWDAEKGENPGFLYQQNTLRDAVVAGCFLNIFNQHCDRVRMANIAQTNNVLQAMILTKGEKMIVTPTYHVFEMFKVHQGAKMLPIDVVCEPYKNGSETIAGITASASKDKDGKIHISICNLNPETAAELECGFEGFKAQKTTGRILTAEAMNAHNTFEKPDEVKPVEFKGMGIKDGKILATIPSKSVVVLEAE